MSDQGKAGTGGEKMAAYVIGHITVKDPEKWGEYRARVPATLAPWGGEVILRGRRITVLSGAHPYTDTVVIRFPDAGAINLWYQSAEYQELIPTREQAAEMVLISYESACEPIPRGVPRGKRA